MKKIFIGSSSESLEIAYKIQGILNTLGADTTCWADDTAFRLSHNTIDNLIQVAHEHNGGVFIFNTDDQIIDPRETGKTMYVPRDNVIAEAGMFAGVLGKESVVLCTVPGVHEISDFKGITNLVYNLEKIDKLKSQLKIWLENDIKEYSGIVTENNVLMLPRLKMHDRYSIDSRLHISDNIYKQICRIRIMNLASNLLINPEIAERGHYSTKDIQLPVAIETILRDTDANIELILAEPNAYNLKDLKTKIANCTAGSPEGTLYSALSVLYKNLSTDTIYRRRNNDPPVRFHFHVMKTSMPFGIFNVEFLDDAQKYNHVKVDLYSASLDNEDERRSFVIWQRDDPQNYKFFVDNFNNIKRNRQICERATLKMLKVWTEKWEKFRLGGKEE